MDRSGSVEVARIDGPAFEDRAVGRNEESGVPGEVLGDAAAVLERRNAGANRTSV